MTRALLIPLLASASAAACKDAAAPAPSAPFVAACAGAPVLPLSPGADTVLTLGEKPCVQLAPGAAAAEYLAVPFSGAGFGTPTGVYSRFLLTVDNATQATALLSPRVEEPAPDVATAFHRALRERDEGIAPAVRAAALGRPQVRAAPAVVGESRLFSVCADRQCSTFASVTATAREVGRTIAIFVDDNAPPGGYLPADLAATRALVDDYLLPTDTLAFGGVSDIDGNGQVLIVLTPAVNRLSTDCPTTGSLVTGYFTGLDLLPGQPGSNGGEVFYGLVPDPGGSFCVVSAAKALNVLPVTMMHELQHMISYNQHVLVRGGSAELSWMNEGLSHFAEELGGRAAPDAPGSTRGSRFTQFVLGNLDNAFGYLARPDNYFLVTPTLSTGSLGERGANWLFVRWLVDQFGGTNPNAFTRKLVQTTRLGLDNVESNTGGSFATLAGQWLTTLFTESDSTLLHPNPRLQLTSWNLQATFASLRAQDPGRFPRAYPLQPDTTVNGRLALSGAMLGGSGAFLRVRRAAGAGTFGLFLADSTGKTLRPGLVPSLAIYRLR